MVRNDDPKINAMRFHLGFLAGDQRLTAPIVAGHHDQSAESVEQLFSERDHSISRTPLQKDRERVVAIGQ
jgi:hypothetical protein